MCHRHTIFDLVYSLGGSFSAEHGIGKIKTKELKKYSSKEEFMLKRNIKKLIDPNNIMNPGKIFKWGNNMEKYQAPIEDMYFALTQLADIDKFSKKINNEDVSSDNIKMIIEEAGKFAAQELDSINQIGDQQGIKLENGLVRMPDSFIKAYKNFVKMDGFQL